MTNTYSFEKTERTGLSLLQELAEGMGLMPEPDYFEHCLDLQNKGHRDIFIIKSGDILAGYGQMNWQPKYPLFAKFGIAEIQDINVLPSFRRQGLATSFITHCEDLAREQGHTQIGISVSVHARFGPAQCLYAKLGYCPDGQGVTYDRKSVGYSDLRPVDGDLCLMLVKTL